MQSVQSSSDSVLSADFPTNPFRHEGLSILSHTAPISDKPDAIHNARLQHVRVAIPVRIPPYNEVVLKVRSVRLGVVAIVPIQSLTA